MTEEKKLVIIGASGHGKVVADIGKKCGYCEIVFLDDDITKKECGDYPVVGTSRDVCQFKDWEIIIAIGNAKVRRQMQQALSNDGFRMATLVHPQAVIGENVTIGTGSVVMAGAVVNPSSCIGVGCIINTCASVDHDCILSDYVHISVGVHVAGTVTIGEGTWIGAGATVSNNVNITGECMIGAGAVVVQDIKEIGTYVGIPARKSK